MADPLSSDTARPAPWLTLVGLGEDGLAGLCDASRSALDQAEIIIGGARHLDLVQAGARGRLWPLPFSTAPVLAARGQRCVVLASGDPFWHGAGSSLLRDLAAHGLSAGEWVSHAAPSCFALAANLLGWRLEETLCLGLHAAPLARLRSLLSRHVRVICTLRDGAAAAELAQYLCDIGHGESRLILLERLGGPHQRQRETTAQGFAFEDVAAPVVAAIEAAGHGLSRACGLADDLFCSDGQITKRPVRALTLSALAPRPLEHLWDIGGGSGSISVEWCLAASGASATCFEPRADRLINIRQNARSFGLDHRINAIEGRAPQILEGGHRRPDCVFVGGGIHQALLDQLWAQLPSGTRLVANGVTLETEALLLEAQRLRGGQLLRVELAEAAALGRMRGWERARPVIQWSVIL